MVLSMKERQLKRFSGITDFKFTWLQRIIKYKWKTYILSQRSIGHFCLNDLNIISLLHIVLYAYLFHFQ